MPGIFYSLTNPLIHEVLMITGNLRKRRAMHDEKRERDKRVSGVCGAVSGVPYSDDRVMGREGHAAKRR